MPKTERAIAAPIDRLRRSLARFGRCAEGGVALLTALALPPLVVVALGAIQLQALVTDRSITQDAADAAALWGAQQLTISQTGVLDRTISYADAQLTDVRSRATVTVTASQIDKRTLKVTVDTQRPGFFMNLFPLGGFLTHVESVSEGVSQSPLCVLIDGAASGDNIVLQNSAKLQALQCMVHTDKSISVAGTALLKAQTIEAGVSSSGPTNPTVYTGAPTIPDPFANLAITKPAACNTGEGSGTFTGTITLAAGRHCGDIQIGSGGTLTLAAGEHYFDGAFKVKGSAKVVAIDAVVIFGDNASTDWGGAADISLEGRRTGSLAGFVMIVDRTRTSPFDLVTDHLSNITGAIYSPSAVFRIQGTMQAGQSSGWTVIAGRSLEISGSPSIVINADYTGFVPVPSGVGNKAGITHVTQ